MRLFSIYVLWIGFTLLVVSNRAMCIDIDSLKQVISTSTDISVLSKTHLNAATYYGENNDEVNVMRHVRILFDFYNTGKVKSINYVVLVTMINYYLRHSHPDSGLYLIPIALRILKEHDATQDEMIRTLLTKADFLSSLEYFKQSLALLDSVRILIQDIDSSDHLLARLNWRVGDIHNSQGEVEKSLTYYLRALKYHEEQNSPNVAGLIYNTAMIYFQLSEFDKAETMFLKSMKINKEKHLTSWLASSYNALGEVYQEKLQYSLAYNYFKLSEHLFDSLKLHNDVAMIYASFGNLFLKMAEDTQEYIFTINEVLVNHVNFIDSAGFHYKAALKLAEEYHHNYVIRMAYRGMGLVLLHEMDYKPAIQFLNLWEDMVEKVGEQISMSEAKKTLSTAHLKEAKRLMKLGKTKDANEHFIIAFEKQAEHRALADSIFSNKKLKEISRMESQYIFDKETEIKDAQLARQKAEIKAKRNQQIALFGGLALVIAFALFMYNRFKITQRQKKIIEQQKLEVENQKDELIISKKEITDSIEYAANIQSAILTSQTYWQKMLENHFIFFRPKDIVSGDFYWAYETPSKKKIWITADCTGHGVPGGFMSMLGNALLNEIIIENGVEEAADILNQLRDHIIKALKSDSGETKDLEMKDGMDLALCILHPNKTLEYAGANNPLWIVRKDEQSSEASWQLIETKADKQPIGQYGELLPFTTRKINLQAGDTLYTFTDGYIDQFGGKKGKKFKSKPFKKLLLSIQEESLGKQKELIVEAFENWKGNIEQVDDVCVVGVRI